MFLSEDSGLPHVTASRGGLSMDCPVFWPFWPSQLPPSLKIVTPSLLAHFCIIILSRSFHTGVQPTPGHGLPLSPFQSLSLGSRFLLKSMPSGWTEHLCKVLTVHHAELYTRGVSPGTHVPKGTLWDFPGDPVIKIFVSMQGSIPGKERRSHVP